MSETSEARAILAPFCKGMGIDFGFGGSAIVPTAITFDLPRSYCPSFEGHPQILRGYCWDIPFICDNAMDYIYSSHLLEDFTYDSIRIILDKWRRILKSSGVLITNCPDQQRFLAHCTATGQPTNKSHKEPDFSLETFQTKVIDRIGGFTEIFAQPVAGPYSWYTVHRKN